MNQEHANDLLAVFALHAVEGDEMAWIEGHLADCPRCRVDFDAYSEVAGVLGNSVETLPDGLWSSISSRLSTLQDEERPPMPSLVREEPGALSAGPQSFRGSRPLRSVPMSRRRMAAVASLAVGAAAVAVLGIHLAGADNQGTAGESARTAVAAALDTPGHRVVKLWNTNHVALAQFVMVPDGRGYLVNFNLPALASTHTYQLWGLAGGRTISLGLMGPSPKLVTFTLAGSPHPMRLGITVEPAGGSVEPSGPMIVDG